MLEVKLVGVNTCHRYKMMRDLIHEESADAGIEIALVEETEVQGILKYGSVNLPMLVIDGTRIAQGNPPSRQALRRYLRK